jgi:hypothetical protein
VGFTHNAAPIKMRAPEEPKLRPRTVMDTAPVRGQLLTVWASTELQPLPMSWSTLGAAYDTNDTGTLDCPVTVIDTGLLRPVPCGRLHVTTVLEASAFSDPHRTPPTNTVTGLKKLMPYKVKIRPPYITAEIEQSVSQKQICVMTYLCRALESSVALIVAPGHTINYRERWESQCVIGHHHMSSNVDSQPKIRSGTKVFSATTDCGGSSGCQERALEESGRPRRTIPY